MVESGIGYFGDARLKKNGELIVQRVTERQEVCVRKLGDDRSEHAKNSALSQKRGRHGRGDGGPSGDADGGRGEWPTCRGHSGYQRDEL